MEESEQNVLNALSKHDKREQQRQQREEQRQQKDEHAEAKQKRKNFFWITFTVLLIMGFAGTMAYLYTHKETAYTDREVHWHALIDLNICGEHIDLPCNVKSEGQVHGQNFCGEHLLHHHFDNILHIEGQIMKKEDIALGKFFDLIGVPFDKDKLMNMTNGDLCPDGKPGQLKMYVNERPREDYRNYTPIAVQDARKQIIKLVFASA